MKYYSFLLALMILTASCGNECSNGVQDINEVGVDCGGNCAPCSSTNGNINVSGIQGLWQYNATSTNTGIGASYSVQSTIKFGETCKLDLTSNLLSSFNNESYFYCYGNIGGCSYPGQSQYSFNNITQTLSGFSIDDLTNDFMSLKFNMANGMFNKYFYSKTPLTQQSASTIEWKVNLTQSFPIDNAYNIVIMSGLSLNSIDTIPISSGQLNYSGVTTISPAFNQPIVYLKVVRNPSIQSNFQIGFTTELKVLGTELKFISGPHYTGTVYTSGGGSNLNTLSLY